jgi:hypothetical protein
VSNHLAIAAVTATLRHLIQGAFDTDAPGVAGARVTHIKPSAPSADLPQTGANIFLYQVTPNTYGRNADLPTRAPDGSVVQRPRAALELHYIISFYGDETNLEPQILLASAVRALHASPVLTRAAIAAMLADPTFLFLAKSDLGDAADLVRFSPNALSLEEMSKLWSIYFQTPYALSVSYLGTMVILDSTLQAQSAPLPVRQPLLTALPLALMRLDSVRSHATALDPVVDGQPILAGYRLVLAGQALATATLARVDDLDVALGPTTPAEADKVELVLPAALRAGTHLVRVVQQVSLGAPPVPHEGTSSNALPFDLCPTITAAPQGPEVVRVTFTPKVGQGQRVALLLNEVVPPGTTPRSFRFDAAAPTVLETGTIDIPVPGTAGATFLVRADVDGAVSPLHFNAATKHYDLPTVTVA